jgi:hypothetical protein
MTTDIGTLAAGLDGHGPRLGVDARDYEKMGKSSQLLFLVHPLFHCRLCGHCIAKHHYLSVHSPLDPTTETFCAVGQLSPPSFSWSFN